MQGRRASRATFGELSPISRVEQGVCMGLRDQWYENGIFYCLDVETYADSDGDGVGDFRGLTRRLDYLAGLGVTCLWLMPFYPSPNRDDGYDVADFCAINPGLGSMSDFSEFAIEAQERGIHVIIDLVPNHTSDTHPWFQLARQDPDSPYRDYYVWREDDPGAPAITWCSPASRTGSGLMTSRPLALPAVYGCDGAAPSSESVVRGTVLSWHGYH
jgi:hypothetical protein